MPTTPNYGWPYQARTDPPDGAALGANLGIAADATVKGIDARLAAAESSVATLLAAAPYRARQTVTGSVAASVTFSGIPTNLRNLTLSYSARADNAVQLQLIFVQINNDTSANYHYAYVQGQNATPAAASAAALTSSVAGVITGTSAPANFYSVGECTFDNWDMFATSRLAWDFKGGAIGTGIANYFAFTGHGLFNVASGGGYTSIKLFPQAGNFAVGSDFQLLGWPT